MKKVYDKARRLLNGVTPLKADCGQLCGKSCCKGDSRTGMLLFPNEETTLNVIENNGRRLAVCGGKCERGERPLGCMMFPFFPVEDGGIKIVSDYRGINICPMVAHRDEIKFSRRFMRRMRSAGKVLYSDPECAAFMREIAEEIEDARKINELIVSKPRID